nr:RhuM family protein [Pseudobutyrivibrio ruminis]
MYMIDYVEQLDSILTSGNRKLLEDSGKVSHDEAIKKAKAEYRKYQENTLSPVEEEYLKSVKGLEKEVKKRKRATKK